MMTWFATKFALGSIMGVLGTLWEGFIRLISTPVGAAIVAILIMYPVATITTKHRVNTSWQTKWDAAAAEAERKRLSRDAEIKREMSAEVDSRTAGLRQREIELQKKVESYVPTTADAQCLTDDSDVRWLHDVRRPDAKRSR